MKMAAFVIAAVVLTLSPAAMAQQGRGQPGMGPVARNCNDDLSTYCPGVAHANRAGRKCLEKNIAKVSAACRTALTTTGGGRGRGQGRRWQ